MDLLKFLIIASLGLLALSPVLAAVGWFMAVLTAIVGGCFGVAAIGVALGLGCRWMSRRFA